MKLYTAVQSTIRAAFGALAIWVASANAQTELPSIKLQTAPLVTPATAVTYYNTLPVIHTPGLAAWASRPPEIQELARALGANRYTASAYSASVYEYVRNNIAIEFRFGLSKGARGALIDQSGTAFDQAHLMVELLRQGSVTASYKVGVLTLTPAQFTAWTGLADAAAACQYLADGGIPATVNGLTSCSTLVAGTPISAVTMLHAWVSTSAGIYDPAYKVQLQKSGIDLAAAMGCGTAAAPTCGSALLSTTLVPATTTTCGVTGVACVTDVNQAGIEGQLTTFATSLQTFIKNYNVTNGTYLAVEDVVGGSAIDTSQSIASGTLLPLAAYAAATYTWTADIPDAFRTTLTVQFDQINQLLFADETAGNRLRLWGYANADASGTTGTEYFTLYSEYRALVTSALSGRTGAETAVVLTVHHPYAANSGQYAAETVASGVVAIANDCQFVANCNPNYWYAPTMTIVQGFGDQSQSSVTQVADLQKRDLFNGPPWESVSDPKHIFLRYWTPPHGGITTCGQFVVPTQVIDQRNPCYQQQEATLIASWLAETSRIRTLAGNVNGVSFQHHHSLGIAMSGDYTAGATILTMQSMLSANSRSAVSVDRLAAFAGAAAVMNRLEGGVFEQSFDAWEGGAALSMMVRANTNHVPFLDVTSSNVSAVTPVLLQAGNNWTSDATSVLTSYATANPGYRLIVPKNGWAGTFTLTNGDVLLYHGAGVAGFGANNDRIAYLASLSPAGTGFPTVLTKGSGGAATDDPATRTEQSARIGDYATKSRKTYGVNLTTGELQLTPKPDLVTGTGDFPFSLAYQRVYSGARTGVLSTFTGNTTSFYASDDDTGAIGGGWTHTLAMKAQIESDAFAGMGRDSGLSSSSVVAGLFTQRWLAKGTVDIRSRLAAIFAAHWTINALNRNVVVVSRPPGRSTFARLPDGSFDPGPGSAEILTQTGTQFVWGAYPSWLWDAGSVNLTLVMKDGSGILFHQMLPTAPAVLYSYPSSYPLVPLTWTFPSGVGVSFAYATTGVKAGLFRACLTSVANNLGRLLTFNDPCGSTLPGGAQWVQDDAGRRISFNTLPTSLGVGNWMTEFTAVAGLQVTGPDGAITQYDYVASPATPTNRAYAGVYRWFSPSDLTVPYAVATFDSLFRVSAITDNSQPVSFSTQYFIGGLYGAQNQKRSETVDALGTPTTTYFGKWGEKLQVINGLGAVTSFTYDAHRRPSTATFPELNWDSFTYDVRSNPLSTTHHPKPGSSLSATVATTTYVEGPTVALCTTASTCNKPLTTVDADNNITSYAYISSTGLLQRVTGPAVTAQPGSNGVTGSAQTDLCYGAFAGTGGSVSLLTGSVQKVDSTTNRVNAYTYSTIANHLALLTATKDPATTYVPPATAGGACTTTAKSGALALPTTFGFDSVGNVGSIDGPIAGTGDTTTYKFDSQRRLTTISAPLNALTRYCYDADGQLVSTNRARVATTDPNAASASGLTSTGQCATAFPTANWQSDTRAYFATGDLKSAADAAGNVTNYAYDALGRQQVVADPDGRQTATVYDVVGQVLATWRGGTGWMTSDGFQNPSAAANSLATATWNPGAYSGSGAFRYAKYAYSLNGKTTSILDANNNTTKLAYDGLYRLQFTLFPDPANGALTCSAPSSDGGTPTCGTLQTYEKYTHDANGNRLSLLTRRGDTISFHFNPANAMDLKTPTGQGVVTYGFNLAGEPLQVAEAASGSQGAHTTAYTYDALGRKLTESNDTRTVSYQYDTLVTARDNAGSRTRTTWPDGYWVSYGFDTLKRLQSVREKSTTTNQLAYYTYDPLSRRVSACLGDLATGQCQAGTWTNTASYAYETDSDLSSLTHALNGTTVALTYGHNASHQITSINATDPFYLPRPTTPAGNAYVPNALNEYTSIGGQAATSDLNGNLLTWTSTLPTAGAHTYTFDSENRLMTAAVSGSGTATVSYDYDALGRRQKKTVSGTITQYLLDGDEEIAELDGSGAVLRRYITAAAIDDRIATIEGSSISPSASERTYFHTNHQGSVVAMTDAAGNATGCAGGTNCQRLAYDEYGNLASAAVTTGEPFRFTGRRYDVETGLYYYRARYYSPQLGRFLQTDPVGYTADNLYSYAFNDPLDRIDPTGEYDVLLWTSPTSVTATFPVAISDPTGSATFTMKQLQEQVATKLSGTTQIFGRDVTVTSRVVPVTLNSDAVKNGLANVITVDKKKTDQSVTDKIGGNKITLRRDANAIVGAHEVAHTGGAGDQHPGGVTALGSYIPLGTPAQENSLMGDLKGPANSQTLNEIATSPTAIIKCAPGVVPPLGGC